MLQIDRCTLKGEIDWLQSVRLHVVACCCMWLHVIACVSSRGARRRSAVPEGCGELHGSVNVRTLLFGPNRTLPKRACVQSNGYYARAQEQNIETRPREHHGTHPRGGMGVWEEEGWRKGRGREREREQGYGERTQQRARSRRARRRHAYRQMSNSRVQFDDACVVRPPPPPQKKNRRRNVNTAEGGGQTLFT